METTYLIILLGLLLFFSRLNAQDSSKEESIQKKFKRTLQKWKDTNAYPLDTIRNVERIFRIESNNFKSKQFLRGYSAGMEKFGNPPFYGWSSRHFGNIRPLGTFEMIENGTGLPKTFIQFKNLEDGMTVLANFLDHYKNAGRWFSTLPEKQQEYEKVLNKRSTPLFDSLY